MQTLNVVIPKGEALYHKIVSNDMNMMIPWYLMASWSYYGLDNPLLTDATFDSDLCPKLYRNWNKLNHRHKYLINRMSVKSKNCREDFDHWPTTIKNATESLVFGYIISEPKIRKPPYLIISSGHRLHPFKACELANVNYDDVINLSKTNDMGIQTAFDYLRSGKDPQVLIKSGYMPKEVLK